LGSEIRIDNGAAIQTSGHLRLVVTQAYPAFALPVRYACCFPVEVQNRSPEVRLPMKSRSIAASGVQRSMSRYPQASMPTYLRFVVADIHDNSGKELGVFHAVLGLREAGKLAEHEEELHDLTRQRFNDNLQKPTRFTASKPPFYRKPIKPYRGSRTTQRITSRTLEIWLRFSRTTESPCGC
jgi:hypothetical protein